MPPPAQRARDPLNAQLTPASAILGRLAWMMFGPMLLAMAFFAVATNGGGWLTGADVGYFLALGLMLLGRWLEFRGGRPETMTGEPATPGNLRRYLLAAGAGGLAAWVFGNLLGNHWLAGG